MNENYKEMKKRIRRLEEMLVGCSIANAPFAQAVSAVRRAAKHGDRARDPSPELRSLLAKAEDLGRLLVG